MKRGLHSKIVANVLALAIVASGSGIYAMENGMIASADDESSEELTKILEAEDIDLRKEWNDKSNIGDGREVTLSDGTKITVKDNGSMRADMTSQQLADKEMGMGINLGNTMEAVYPVENKANLTKTDYDKGWDQPITTRAYIDLLHTYGFNTLRIPVAWSNGDIDDGTYTIRGALLDRVEEVANYALDNGMYVVINDHWDNQWWGQFGACKRNEAGEKVPDEETRANAMKRYERYWTQISERFKDYSDHLILEGANEELGDRLNDAICLNGPAKGYAKPDNAGKDVEVLGGDLKTDALYKKVNEINQKFVDIVRGTGGNNATRHLLIPGYDTDMGKTADERFQMPKDTEANGKNKLFVSVHYYAPTDFALDGATGTYTKKDQEYTKNFFANLKRFSDEGYAAIIGECGFCNPSGVTGSVTQWLYDTATEGAKYHAVPVLWDTGAFFDRTKPEINYKDIAIFYNTVNQTKGNTDIDRVTGGKPSQGETDTRKIPPYLDSKLWGTPGLHAYVLYQTSTWDYRNVYKPLRALSKNEHSWEYIHAAGSEISAEKAKVVDVQMTADGQYTVSIEGIDLSAANSFKMLGVSTDIERKLYPDIKVTNATVKFDGKETTDAPFDLIIKKDDKYLDFMAINVYDADNKNSLGLGAANENETLVMPQKSIEISFKITGLDKPLADIASGEYVNPETGEKLGGSSSTPPPSQTNQPAPSSKPALKKGASFTAGNYKYKVTKVASSKKGTVTLAGLAKKGKSAKKLSVATTVKDKNGASYTVNAIGAKAFNGAKATSITLNKQVKKIPSSAFLKCKKLSSITFKAKLTKVAKNAFKGCKKSIKVKGTAKKANKKILKKTSYKKFK